MRIYLTQLLVTLVLSFSVVAQEGKLPPFVKSGDDNPGTKLVGNVQMVMTTTYRYEEIVDSGVTLFGPNLRKIQSISHIRELEPHSDRMLDSDRKTLYLYDEKSINLIRIVSTDEDEKSVTTKYFYDTKNRLIEELFLDSRNRLSSKTKYEYVKDKKEVKKILYLVFDGRETLFRSYVFSYNDRLLWTKRVEYDGEGREQETIIYEYDDRGFLIKKSLCCANKNVRLFTYKWDKFGNWVDRIESQVRSTPTGKTSTKELTRVHRVIAYQS